MKKLKLAAIAAFLAAGAAGTIAVAATPAQIVATRHSNFKEMGRAMKAILDELKKPAPSADLIRTNAGALNTAANKVGGYFPAGTGPGAVKTHALPAIWQNNAEFQGAVQKLVTATGNLQAASASGNLDAVKSAIPAVGGSCKGCHDKFRERD